ncbi:aldose 1-epimerase [Paenibacillus lutrae]|uniref:Aldose 1-epimerase n=1 Tax=Paenibacillus lutrae TaxID=2078573 RepID=A0A7X3JZP1_9BACL|nr:aldose 1-epimerase [Paenibacillus lutrae]MVP00232.1 aldose 1-epimerase [Paenibacillus lutrae]
MTGNNNAHSAYEGDYQGMKAVWLKWGRYEAAMLPEYGGNLIAFRDTENAYQFLHEPKEDELESFKKSPGIHGIPVLYPPNRYEDGKIPWNGKEFQLPVNEPGSGNHLHGYLHTSAWKVEDYGQTGCESYVVVSSTVDEQHAMYQYLPFRFTVRLRYALGEDGLSQQLFFRNDGSEAIPCLLAFHTAINAPFAPDSSADDYRVKLTIGERWEMNDRLLPTGKFQPLTQEEIQLRDEGISPYFADLNNHYTALAQNGRNRMELTDTRSGVTLVYDVGTSYKQWMIWNNFGTEGFFCPEPQINLVNAPKSPLPAESIGLFALEPGEIWEATARFYVKR